MDDGGTNVLVIGRSTDKENNETDATIPSDNNAETSVSNSLDFDLIQENRSLKETLQQNNLAMKQQFSTLCLWQEEIIKLHYNHKERFDETKQIIKKLMAENKELKAINDENLTKSGMQDLQAEKEELQKRLTEAGLRLNNMLLKVNRKRCQPTVKEKELGSVVEMLTERLEIAERARRQLEMDVERLNAQKSRLEQKLFDKNTSNMGNSGKRIITPEIIKTDSEAMQQIKSVAFKLNKVSAEFDESFESNDICLNVEELQNRLSNSKAYILQQRQKNEKLKTFLNLAIAEYDSLLNFHLKNIGELGGKQIIQSSSSQCKECKHMESTDLLLAKIVSQDEELSFKDKQIETLRTRLKVVEGENEAIPILKAQVSVYQTDFNIERKNREDLAAAREKLLADMRHLLKQNKQLMEELDRLQSGHSSAMKNDFHDQHFPNMIGLIEETAQIGDLVCPNPECSMRFATVEPLQVHVEQCLKLTD